MTWSDEERQKMEGYRKTAESQAAQWKIGDLTSTLWGPACLIEEQVGGFLVQPLEGGAPFRMDTQHLRTP